MKDTITLLIKNTQYFHMEVHPDRIDELDDWQTVVDYDSDFDQMEQVSDDYYEFVEVVRDDSSNNRITPLQSSSDSICKEQTYPMLDTHPRSENPPERDSTPLHPDAFQWGGM